MKNLDFLQSKLVLVGMGLLLILAISLNITCKNDHPDAPKGLDFPKVLTPVIPADVDTVFKKKLESEKKFAEVQRLFDIVSWQTFVAVNWPTDNNGKPSGKLSDKGLPVWTTYKESQDVFRPDGSAPSPWGSDRDIKHPNHPSEAANKANRLLILHNKHIATANDVDEANQAFSGDIWDQNGNLIMYEIVLNESEFNYVVTNKLYNIDGQIAFSQAGKTIAFPSGTFGSDDIGAVEIKVAWKILDPDKDIVSRYLTMDGFVPDPKDYTVSDSPFPCTVQFPDNPTFITVKLGMVGMHISHKTTSSPQWIWSTFEQVDNLTADPLVTGKNQKGETVSLTPSFYDPFCTDCLPNTCPTADKDGKRKSQLMRMIPIPGDKVALNNQAAQVLAGQNSVLQYYQLIDTQWPTAPKKAPTPHGQGVASVNNKSGGNVTPVFLTNITMESYFQIGKQTAWQQEEDNNGSPLTPADTTLIWATESCTGCHSSAGIAIGDTVVNGIRKAQYGKQLSADFSWLLTKKANFVKKE